MNKRFIVAVVCPFLGLISPSGAAMAETVGRLECSVVSPANSEPIGDKDGHLLRTLQYSCVGVEGLLKGALYSGSSISEWDGPQGTYLTGGGIIRVAGGFAVTQITEGKGSVVMKDGKPAGAEASGTGLFKFASGTLGPLSGKADKWEAKPAGFGRFNLEIMTDEGAVRVSKE